MGCGDRFPGPGCFELDLDGIPLGAGLLETWVRADRLGWECEVQPSMRLRQVGLRCSDGVGPKASTLTLGFVRDALAMAELARMPGGPEGRCEESHRGLDSWTGVELERLTVRYGPPIATPHAPPGDSYSWSTTEESLSLRIDRARGALALSGQDRVALRTMRLDAIEYAHLVDLVHGEIPAGTMAEEVAWELRAIAAAEHERHSELGHFLAAGPHPAEAPSGEYVDWDPEEAEGFALLRFTPSLGRVSYSYAVALGPQPCAAEECGSFTAVARCDPEGDGQLVYWGLVQRGYDGKAADGPFGVCRASGVYAESGELLGHDVVGLCEPPRGATARSPDSD